MAVDSDGICALLELLPNLETLVLTDCKDVRDLRFPRDPRSLRHIILDNLPILTGLDVSTMLHLRQLTLRALPNLQNLKFSDGLAQVSLEYRYNSDVRSNSSEGDGLGETKEATLPRITCDPHRVLSYMDFTQPEAAFRLLMGSDVLDTPLLSSTSSSTGNNSNDNLDPELRIRHAGTTTTALGGQLDDDDLESDVQLFQHSTFSASDSDVVSTSPNSRFDSPTALDQDNESITSTTPALVKPDIAPITSQLVGSFYGIFMFAQVGGSIISILYLQGESGSRDISRKDANMLFIIYGFICLFGSLLLFKFPDFPGRDCANFTFEDFQAAVAARSAANELKAELASPTLSTSSASSSDYAISEQSPQSVWKVLFSRISAAKQLVIECPAIRYPLISYIGWGAAVAFGFSGFLVENVTESLGSAKIPFANLVLALACSITCLTVPRFLGTIERAYMATLIGGLIFLFPMILAVIYPSHKWPRANTEDGRGSPAQWFLVLLMSAMQGCGDGTLLASMNTMIGLQYPGARSSIAFSFCGAHKSLGFAIMLFLNACTSYTAQIVTALVGLSAFLLTRVIWRKHLHTVYHSNS